MPENYKQRCKLMNWNWGNKERLAQNLCWQILSNHNWKKSQLALKKNKPIMQNKIVKISYGFTF